MNIYLYINLIIIFLAIFFNVIKLRVGNEHYSDKGVDYTNNMLFCGLISMFMIFISGFRGPFSVDYYNYVYLFNKSGESTISHILFGNIELERGFSFLNKIIYSINKEPVLLMTVISAIIVISYIYTFKKYSDYVWLSVLLLLTLGSYYTSFNTIRQFLAAALTFVAAKYIYEEKFTKYVLCIVLISTIHVSTLIMIPFYYLLRIRWNKWKNMFLLLILISIYGVIFIKHDMFVNFFIERFFKGYSGQNAFGISEGVSFIYVARPVLLFVFSLYSLTKMKLEDVKFRVWFNASIYLLLFSILSTRVEMIQRFTYFFLPYLMLLIPNTLKKIDKKAERTILIVIVVILVSLYSYLTQRNEMFYFIWK